MAASNSQSMIDFLKNSSFMTADDAKIDSSFEESVIYKPNVAVGYQNDRVVQLEQRLAEKEKILKEMSTIHDETYDNNLALENKLSDCFRERDKLLRENENLKIIIEEKEKKIEKLEKLLSSRQIPVDEDTTIKFTHEKDKFVILKELNALREKYNDREELILNLQGERARLRRQIEELKSNSKRCIDANSRQIEELNKRFFSLEESLDEQLSRRYPSEKTNWKDMINEVSNTLQVHHSELVEKVKHLIKHRKKCKWKKVIAKFREVMKMNGESNFSREDIWRWISNLADERAQLKQKADIIKSIQRDLQCIDSESIPSTIEFLNTQLRSCHRIIGQVKKYFGLPQASTIDELEKAFK
ncbi:unnamed protein product [Blepharisma stoltei]|uniref:Uncharacterized protein n=1 Tax=Blepharisma stoltei TaxID=1481888 RepID=A0AAU9K2P3_9CILI|nr:unnamed protein product [Blepharisma stoltei]